MGCDKCSNILSKYYRITMSDGSIWAVPVGEIATNHADAHLDEFDGDLVKSLYESTLPEFEENKDTIIDWASGNMNWEDVRPFATRIKAPLSHNTYAEEWTQADNIEVM